MASDPEDQLRAGALLWALAREGIHLQGVPFVVVIEIGDILADGIAKGLSSQTIAEQIAPLLDGDFKRALLIVRTERARAMTSAEYDNAREAGGYDKQWLDDEKACPIWRANAAQGAIPITRPFQGGALYPPQHPNCRCALQPVAHHQEKPLAYLIDDHPESDDTPPVRRPPRKVRKVAKMAQPDRTKAAKPARPLAKSEAPDLSKAMLLDQLDDGLPLAQLVKACSADPVFAATLRRRLEQPTALEKSVDAMQAEIHKVLSFVEPQSHYRHRTNGNSVHITPPLPQRSACHSSPDDQLTEQLAKADAADDVAAQQLTKAIAADPRAPARVATIRRLLGVDGAYDRARAEKLQARIATLRSDINRALMIGRAVPQSNDQSANVHN